MLREHKDDDEEPSNTICGETSLKEPPAMSETQTMSEPKTLAASANSTKDSKSIPSPTPSSADMNPFLTAESSHQDDPPGLFSEHSLQCPTSEPTADDEDDLLLRAVFDILESSAEESDKAETPSEDTTNDGIVAQFTHLQPELHCLDFLQEEWDKLHESESARGEKSKISEVVASTTVVDGTGNEYSLSVTFSTPIQLAVDAPPATKEKGKARKEKSRADVQVGTDAESIPRAKRNAAAASRFKTQKLYSEAGPNGGKARKKK
ncbi:hypothetical protein HDU81_005640 [Chytriomyces hyalinus]|nr:hypothetical protein HDU81_005640 [Chytriomyces hyalinus]